MVAACSEGVGKSTSVLGVAIGSEGLPSRAEAEVALTVSVSVDA